MKYVYLLRSATDPRRRYVGITDDLSERLRAHNLGKARHTSKYRPWKLIAYFAFDDPQRATAFERYLKTGSGHAFGERHFW